MDMDALNHTITQIALITFIASLVYYLGGKLIRVLVQWLYARAHRYSVNKQDLEKRSNTLTDLSENMWRILTAVVALLAILRLFFTTDELAPLFASAGVIGVAFGFGAQSLVKDFLSGLFIISENQYRVGDVVEIDGFGGTVERIGSRSTVLRDVNGNVHYFPNGMVQHVINKTMDYGMARFELAISPEADLDKAIEIVNTNGDTLAQEEKWKTKIIDAPHFVMLGDATATAVTLIVSGKTQPSDQWSVASEMRRRIIAEFEKQGISLGYQASSAAFTPKSRKK